MRKMRAAVLGRELRTGAGLSVFLPALFAVLSSRFSGPQPLFPVGWNLLLVTRHSSFVTSAVTSARQEAA